MEIWKDIPEYEGFYQVSNYGRIKSCKRVVKGPRGDQRLKEKIIKALLNKSGYPHVSLCKDGKKRTIKVHRLVALVFLEGDKSLTVNHIDECKTNNNISNLEYLTQGDNTRAWRKNNPERTAEMAKKYQEAYGQPIIDTQTGNIFPSINSVGNYMHEVEGAFSPHIWINKIKRKTQDRFQFLNN